MRILPRGREKGRKDLLESSRQRDMKCMQIKWTGGYLRTVSSLESGGTSYIQLRDPFSIEDEEKDTFIITNSLS